MPSAKRAAPLLPRFTDMTHLPPRRADATRQAPAPGVVPVLTPSTAPLLQRSWLVFVQVWTIRPSTEVAVQFLVRTTRANMGRDIAARASSARSCAVVTCPHS